MVSVSTIIPFYNNADTLKSCIQSAIEQEIQGSEILLIDNNSTDNSLHISNEFAQNNSQVYLYQCTEQGSAYARNLGLEHAKGEYIQFLDADDLLKKDKIKIQLEENKNNADIIVSPYTEHFKGKKIAYNFNTDIWAALIEGKLGITSSNLFKTSSIRDIKGWDTNIPNHQDYELMFRLLKNGGLVQFVNSSLTIKRSREYHSISSETEQSYPKVGIELRENIRQYLQEKNILNEKYEKLALRYFYDKITWLYRFDPNEAVRLYHHYFSEKKNRSVIPLKNRIIESVFGFSTSRKIKHSLFSK